MQGTRKAKVIQFFYSVEANSSKKTKSASSATKEDTLKRTAGSPDPAAEVDQDPEEDPDPEVLVKAPGPFLETEGEAESALRAEAPGPDQDLLSPRKKERLLPMEEPLNLLLNPYPSSITLLNKF